MVHEWEEETSFDCVVVSLIKSAKRLVLHLSIRGDPLRSWDRTEGRFPSHT